MENPYIPNQVRLKRRSPIERYFAFIDLKRPSDKLFFYAFLVVFIVSGTILLLRYNNTNIVITPATGGELREGIVGSPRFVNPTLAITRADQDMSALIFDGLMEITETGELLPNLAESVTISTDALVYNVVLRQDTTFHDGDSVTADDVIFTIELIKNPILKSPLQGNFDGVEVQKINDHEINFVLAEPYTPFLQNLTVGILPRHEWEDLSIDQIPFSQHNTEPVGSGPYKIKSVKRNDSGLIDGYVLEAFNSAQHDPKIDILTISFFPNEETLATAIKTDKVDSATGLTTSLDDIIAVRSDLKTSELPLPRTFGIFFNQNKSAALRQPEVRRALELAINRDALVEEALQGHGIPISGPIPAGFQHSTENAQETTATANGTTVTPATILDRAGWVKNSDGIWSKEIDSEEIELSIDIATANLPFLADTAAYLERTWSELGVRVSVRQFEQSDLTQAIIRTRDYEALLFGTALGRGLDFYPFWHSSQRNDPGLNVALYANITVDAALEKARTSTSTEARGQAIDIFLEEFTEDIPAIFLYVPSLLSVAPKELERIPIERLVAPHERFTNIDDWYIRTESVWPIFNQ